MLWRQVVRKGIGLFVSLAASTITGYSFNGSVIELTIQCGSEVTNVEIDLVVQQLNIS